MPISALLVANASRVRWLAALPIVIGVGVITPTLAQRLGYEWVLVLTGLLALFVALILVLRRTDSALLVGFVLLLPLPISKTLGDVSVGAADLALVGCGCLALYDVIAGRSTVARLDSRRLLVASLGAFLLALMMSISSASDGSVAFGELARWTKAFVLALLLSRLLRSTQAIRMVLTIFVAAAGIVALYAVSQFATQGQTQLAAGLLGLSETTGNDLLRVAGTFGYANTFAGFLALAPAIGIGLLAGRRLDRRGHVTMLFATAVVVVALLLTFSRGGWVAGLTGAAVALLLSVRGWTRSFLVAVLGLLVTAAGIGVVQLLGVSNAVVERIAALTSSDLTSDWGRPAYWAALLSLLNGHELTGLGAGNLTLLNPFIPPGIAARDAHANNLYLQELLELGWLGILALITIIVAVARVLRRALRAPIDRDVVVATTAAWTVVASSGAFDYLLFSGQILNAVSVLLAITIALASSAERRKDAF